MRFDQVLINYDENPIQVSQKRDEFDDNEFIELDRIGTGQTFKIMSPDELEELVIIARLIGWKVTA